MGNKLERPVGRLMFALCSQSIFSLLVYHIYSLTDTYFVTNGVGSFASGAIGIVSPMLTLVYGVSSALGTGGASMISRRLGEGNTSKSREVVGCMMFVWLVFSLLATTLGLLFLKPILLLLGCTSEIYPYALDYGRIMLLSIVISTGFSGAMRAQGEVGYSTIQWCLPVIINLILDPVFIYRLKMGIAGAALATLTAQLFSAASSVYFFFFRKTTPCRISLRNIRWDTSIFQEIASIGLPSFLGNLGGSMVGALGNQVLKAIGGAEAISAFSIVNRIQSFASTPFTGVMQGIQPMLGFDSGRGDRRRVLITMRAAFLLVSAYGCAAAICFRLGSGWLMQRFTENQQILYIGAKSLTILCWALVPGGILPVVQAYLQALGYGRKALYLSLGSIFLIRLPMLLIAGMMKTLTAVWWTLALTDWFIALFATYQYRKEKNQL